ncbi:MAG: hypothetical protein QOJ12_124 [Thermoleophilales bacterium]|jgi:uncharacterized protein YndB with AHSA1/START domain|nr:hypothetical protein [Thermoleophilales bacterium]
MTPTQQDGSFQTIDGTPALHFERRLSHPVETVWRAVTEPAGLAHWFPAQVTVDLRPGGAMRFVFVDHDELPSGDGEVLALEEQRLFAFTWGPSRFLIELEPQDDGAACLLRFTHFLDERDAAARDMAGWHVCFNRMEEYLGGDDTGAPSNEPDNEWRSLYEQYVDRGVPSGAAVPGEALG